jgi:hypothetical protein
MLLIATCHSADQNMEDWWTGFTGDPKTYHVP